MSPFIAELVGTAILVILGDGCCANVVLNKTKGNNSGWVIIVLGWGVAVYVPAMIFGPASGGHFNPALSIAFALTGKLEMGLLPAYIAAQMLGGFIGAVVVWIHYKPHFDATPDPGAKLGVLATGPAIRNTAFNLISEIIATFFLVFFFWRGGDAGNGWFAYAVIMTLGIGLGGTTGYAMNPARDLSPRIVNQLFNRCDSDWGYAWIPVVGPIIGGILGAFFAQALG